MGPRQGLSRWASVRVPREHSMGSAMSRSRLMVGTAVTAVVIGTTAVAGAGGSAAVSARPDKAAVVQTRSALGNGLGRLVQKPAAQQKVAGQRLKINQNALTIRDGKGRVL